MDALPVLSQVKSLVQAMCGQLEEARITQENFSRQCPVISQLRSFGEWVSGDEEAAEKTQIEFGHFMLGVINGVPAVGHIKGAVHYSLGDKENGDAAMKAASHTSAVVAGGVVGMITAGPVGACAVGAAAGAAVDITITGVDSAIKKEFQPFGLLQPLEAPTDAGKWADAVGGVALDALVGRAAGAAVRGLSPGIGVEEFSKATARAGSAAPGLADSAGFAATLSIAGIMTEAKEIYLKVEEFALYIFEDKEVKKIIKNYRNDLIDKVKKKVFPASPSLSPQKENPNKKKTEVQSKVSLPKNSPTIPGAIQSTTQCGSYLRILIKNGCAHVYNNDYLIMVLSEGNFLSVKGTGLEEMKNDEVFTLAKSGEITKLKDKAVIASVNKQVLSNIQDVEKNAGLYLNIEEDTDEIIPLEDRKELIDLKDKAEDEELFKKQRETGEVDIQDFDSLSPNSSKLSKGCNYKDDLISLF